MISAQFSFQAINTIILSPSANIICIGRLPSKFSINLHSFNQLIYRAHNQCRKMCSSLNFHGNHWQQIERALAMSPLI